MWQAAGRTGYLGFFILAWFAIGYYGGRWVDRRLGTEPWFMWVGMVLAVLGTVNEIVRVVKQYNKSIKEDDAGGPKQP